MGAELYNGFPQELIKTAKPIASPEDRRVLLEDLHAFWNGWKITVRAGYTTDGASIPRVAWRTVGHPWGAYLPAAVVHDILYETEVWERAEADRCFHDLMVCLPVNWLSRKVIYAAVRIGGGPTWHKHTAESVAHAKRFLDLSYAFGGGDV